MWLSCSSCTMKNHMIVENQIDHVFFSKCPTFLCSNFLKCPILPFSEPDSLSETIQIIALKPNGLMHFKDRVMMGSYFLGSFFSIWSWNALSGCDTNCAHKSKNFPYFQFNIYTFICSVHIKLWASGPLNSENKIWWIHHWPEVFVTPTINMKL